MRVCPSFLTARPALLPSSQRGCRPRNARTETPCSPLWSRALLFTFMHVLKINPSHDMYGCAYLRHARCAAAFSESRPTLWPRSPQHSLSADSATDACWPPPSHGAPGPSQHPPSRSARGTTLWHRCRHHTGRGPAAPARGKGASTSVTEPVVGRLHSNRRINVSKGAHFLMSGRVFVLQ